MKSEMGNMSEKLEAMRNAVAEDGGQLLLILQVRLTFNNAFFVTRNFKFYDFLTLL